jgi:hypothetical protein
VNAGIRSVKVSHAAEAGKCRQTLGLNPMYETDLVRRSHLSRLLCSDQSSTVGLHEQVLRTASLWSFVYLDITRGGRRSGPIRRGELVMR